jgi:hypothetical protein
MGYHEYKFKERVSTCLDLLWLDHDARWICAAQIEMNASGLIAQCCIDKTQPTNSTQKVLCKQIELEPRRGERICRSKILAGRA